MGGPFKDDIYANYASFHVIPRKGIPTVGLLRKQSRHWRAMYGRLLPSERNSTILDIGCGFGSIVWWLQCVGYFDVSGIDISAEQIHIAKDLGINNVEVADALEFLNGKKELYDVIIARDIIEHFTKPAILEMLRACHHALKAGGRFIMQTPNGESPFFGRLFFGDFTHETAFTCSSLHQVLKTTGFSGIDILPVEPPVVGAVSFVRLGVWKIIAQLYKFLILVEAGTSRKIVTQNIMAVAQK